MTYLRIWGAHPGRAGMVVALVGMLLFALNDTMGKWLVASYTVGQVVLIRSIAALAVLAPFLWATGLRPLFAVERPGLQLLRAILSSAEVFAFYFAVSSLPLADVMTYWLASPLYVAVLAPFLLGERVGALRWAAILLGFLGVVIALNPSGAALSPAALISVVGSMSLAFMMLTGRFLRGTPDTVLVFWQTLSAAMAGLIAIPMGWQPVAPSDLWLLLLLGVVAMLAHVLINRALKLADAAVVAPIQYTLLFWAVIFGYIVFGDIPSPAMAIGAALIVASGLIVFFLGRRQTAP